jgi:hypothetical protein
MELIPIMSTTTDPVAAAVAAAQAQAAAAIAAQAANLPVPTSTGSAGTAVAPVRPGKPLTMEDMSVGSIAVDSWIGVKEHGFLLGSDKTLHSDEISVEIDLKAVAPNKCVKYGNPPIYLKSYDGITCVSGGSWEDALAKANRASPGAREYSSADVPMKLLHTITGKGGKVLEEEGSILGYSIATTGWTNWQRFWNDCMNAGLAGQTVKARLGFEKRTNKNGNIWGVITFTLAN